MRNKNVSTNIMEKLVCECEMMKKRDRERIKIECTCEHKKCLKVGEIFQVKCTKPKLWPKNVLHLTERFKHKTSTIPKIVFNQQDFMFLRDFSVETESSMHR